MFKEILMLRHFDDVKKFVELANSKSYDIELVSGKYTVNAKSIMGVFSLDLTKPVEIIAHCDEKTELSEQLNSFLAHANN